MSENNKKLEWTKELSVNVHILDKQHKYLIDIINKLIDSLGQKQTKEVISSVIGDLVLYKKTHFSTEEKYFAEFNYEGAVEHIAAHKYFNEHLIEMQKQYGDDIMGFGFALVDFLEDWLVEHLMTMDRQYIKCFNEHGLK
jgi:hemerythrin